MHIPIEQMYLFPFDMRHISTEGTSVGSYNKCLANSISRSHVIPLLRSTKITAIQCASSPELFITRLEKSVKRACRSLTHLVLPLHYNVQSWMGSEAWKVLAVLTKRLPFPPVWLPKINEHVWSFGARFVELLMKVMSYVGQQTS